MSNEEKLLHLIFGFWSTKDYFKNLSNEDIWLIDLMHANVEKVGVPLFYDATLQGLSNF